jgi:pimeloyl-ACP methyl ester carboxylesterase
MEISINTDQGPNRRLFLAGAALTAGVAACAREGVMGAQQNGYAQVDGLDVYYEVHGGDLTPDVVPLVLLHGGMMAIETAFAADLLPRFSSTWPVIAIEQQGHGHTGDRPGPITVERLVDDTAGVLAHLGVRRAHLFGHSLGGMIATGMCIRHPGQVASAAIVSATYTLDGMIPDIVAMQTDPTHVPAPETVPLLPTEADFESWRAHFNQANPDPASFESVLARLNTMLSEWRGWTRAELGGIRAPVLLAIGDNDFTRIEHAVEMRDLIPGAKLAVLPNTTHMNIIERGAWLEPMVEETIAAAK